MQLVAGTRTPLTLTSGKTDVNARDWEITNARDWEISAARDWEISSVAR